MSIKTDHQKKVFKINGPRTKSFGTLKSIFIHLLYSLIILTIFSLLLLWNQFQGYFIKSISTYISDKSWYRQAKDFDRSIHKVPHFSVLSKHFFHFLFIIDTHCCELWHFLKLTWHFDDNPQKVGLFPFLCISPLKSLKD